MYLGRRSQLLARQVCHPLKRRAQCRSNRRCLGLAGNRHRVFVGAVHTELKMQMRASGSTGRTDQADVVPLL